MENKIKQYISAILENDHYMGLYDVEKFFETYTDIKEAFEETKGNISIEDFIEGYIDDLENPQVLKHLDYFPEDRKKEPWKRPLHICDIDSICPFLLKQVIKYDDCLDLDVIYNYNDFSQIGVEEIIYDFIWELNKKLKNTIFDIFNTF